eukprot:2536081-Amphidinium_carterae.1
MVMLSAVPKAVIGHYWPDTCISGGTCHSIPAWDLALAPSPKPERLEGLSARVLLLCCAFRSY